MTFEEWWDSEQGNKLSGRDKRAAQAAWDARGEEDAKVADAEASEWDTPAGKLAGMRIAQQIRQGEK